MTTSILVTKLFIPSSRPELVLRPRLIKQLDAGLHCKLTLISAPAGFGKTTLVSEWVQHLRLDISDGIVNRQSSIVKQIAWLSLDENDNDLTRFLTYFFAALSRSDVIDTAFTQEAMNKLISPQPSLVESLLTELINEVAVVSDKVIFVLDDYHLIETQSIHDALAFFVENMPPQMHLVIATREDPFLPLSRLRARSQLSELRALELRFANSETADFLNEAMGLALSAADIAALEKRTEGWIAGLQLAAISLQGRSDASSLVQSFTGSHRLVLDYLIEDVLHQQPQHVQQFLLETAVLHQLAAPLCNAVTKQENSQSILEMLDRANLFVIPLDNERQWYRYHHLFAEVLKARLQAKQPEQVAELHLRASKWFEQKQQPADAIRHALAGDDLERVAALAELAWPAWHEGYKSHVWLGWVQQLPDALVRARPVLNMDYTWSCLSAGRLEDADRHLKVVEKWLATLDSSSNRIKAPSPTMVVVDETQFQALPASVASARAYLSQAFGDVHGTVKYAAQALERLPEDDTYNRSAITAILGLSYWAIGDLVAAHKTFTDGIFQNDDDRIKGTFVVADIKLTLGLIHEAINFCEETLQIVQGQGEPMTVGTEDVYMGLSTLHREQGDLETAVQDLATGKKLGDQVKLPDWQYRWCMAQACLQASLGEWQSALDLLNEAERVFVRTPLPVVRPIPAMKARVWVKRGKLNDAQRWVTEQGLSVDDELSFPREFEHVTLARILIAQHAHDQEETAIQEAMGLLTRLLKAAEVGQRTGSIIEILMLQALAYQAQGSINPALKSLERALTLAEIAGFFQMFVDEGLPMTGLLKEALARGIAPGFVQRLLTATPADKPEQPILPQYQPQSVEWLDPLSDREVEVLQLIAEGLTNPEIATRLFLSLNTIKVHSRNIYSKLDVHNRTQAVTKARALGILSAI
ncbi:MAG: helix-turn-helix transcriptional regulator [Chloroflexi bacterium]|nr:MAG: helix-turn-helix transcriptional regulator [Chloroflexota bacterium]